MNVQVDVQIACDEGGIPDSNSITTWVARTLEAAGRRTDAEVSVRVVDAKEMQSLNRDFRQIDKPTNVLSFPAGEIEGLPEDAQQPLGDVIVCAHVVKDESFRQGKAIGDHWAHLVVHGTLHLLGFDHETASQALKMERLEAHILSINGVADPYQVSHQET